MISSKGSKDPVFTLPAWRQTTVGPSRRGKASGRIRPCPSTGTLTTRDLPNPTTPSALYIVECVSALTMTVIGGAPNNPSASASQPTRCSSDWRAAASDVICATVVPVTNPPAASAGRPSNSFVQRSAISSSCVAPGDETRNAPCCSHALASQCTASAPGSTPLLTYPK